MVISMCFMIAGLAFQVGSWLLALVKFTFTFYFLKFSLKIIIDALMFPYYKGGSIHQNGSCTNSIQRLLEDAFKLGIAVLH